MIAIDRETGALRVPVTRRVNASKIFLEKVSDLLEVYHPDVHLYVGSEGEGSIVSCTAGNDEQCKRKVDAYCNALEEIANTLQRDPSHPLENTNEVYELDIKVLYEYDDVVRCNFNPRDIQKAWMHYNELHIVLNSDPDKEHIFDLDELSTDDHSIRHLTPSSFVVACDGHIVYEK